MKNDLTEDAKSALIEALMIHLDTRDKRFMFLKCMFKEHTHSINLEGSPKEVAYNIYKHFENNNMLGSLMACINNVFETDLYLELDV